MMILGINFPNITCPKCRFRHPAAFTCEAAKLYIETERAQRERRAPAMKFSGNSLVMVHRAVELAIAELHTQIASCPDVFEYADEIAELECERARFENLLGRIEAKLLLPVAAKD